MSPPRITLTLLPLLLCATTAAAAPNAARERRLHVATAEASSYLVNDWNRFSENYLPLYIGDDDPKTAWTLKTEGVGEWIRLRVTPMAGATNVRLKVRNGYQKSPRLFAANSRARLLKVVLLPSHIETEIELKDVKNWQEVAVEQPAGTFDGIEFHVQSVYGGSKYDDLCISDVQLFVTASTPENPAYEKRRFAKIQTWKKERLQAAKLFQSKLGKSLPVAAAYTSGQHETADQEADQNVGVECRDDGCHLPTTLHALFGHFQTKGQNRTPPPSLATAQSLVASSFGAMVPVRIATRDKRPLPRIDGLCSIALDACLDDPCYEALPLPQQLGFLNAQSLLPVEQTGLPTVQDVLALTPAACHQRQPTTFAWITRDPPGADGQLGMVRALLTITCGMVEGREETYPSSRSQLLVYDNKGALEVMASGQYAAVLTWDPTGSEPKLAEGYVARDGVREGWTVQAASIVATP